jgi:hypothetical protein
MIQADDCDRRASTSDRRGALGGSGRRAEDHLASRFSTMIPCTRCDVAWAALSLVVVNSGQPLATYICRRCGQIETSVGPV